MKFTSEEETLIYLYRRETREETCQSLREVVPYIDEEEMRVLVEQLIRKLEQLSEEAFAKTRSTMTT